MRNCPIPDSTGIVKKHQIKTLNVHVYDGSTTAQAWAEVCVQPYDAQYGFCSERDWVYPVGWTGVDTLRPARTWHNHGVLHGLTTANGHEYDFGYVNVGTGSDSSKFLGVYYAW